MNLNQISTWSRWTGRIGSLLCILLFLIILDALVARFRESPNRVSGLPGERIPISGPLAGKVDNLRDLGYRAGSKDLSLQFETLQSGYWMGGYLWTGYLSLGPKIQAGRYELTVITPPSTADKTASLFRIEVYNNERERQRHSKSLVVCYLGITAWSAGFSLVPLIILTFGAVYSLSRQAEGLMAGQGKAEVYRVRKRETGYEIFFGLGKQQGLHPGERLTLSNHQGKTIGSIEVETVYEDHATATVDLELPILPGFVVSRI